MGQKSKRSQVKLETNKPESDKDIETKLVIAEPSESETTNPEPETPSTEAGPSTKSEKTEEIAEKNSNNNNNNMDSNENSPLANSETQSNSSGCVVNDSNEEPAPISKNSDSSPSSQKSVHETHDWIPQQIFNFLNLHARTDYGNIKINTSSNESGIYVSFYLPKKDNANLTNFCHGCYENNLNKFENKQEIKPILASKNTNFMSSQMLTNMSKMRSSQNETEIQPMPVPNPPSSQPPNPINLPQTVNRNTAVKAILAKYTKNGKIQDLMSTPMKNNKRTLNTTGINTNVPILPSPVMSGQASNNSPNQVIKKIKIEEMPAPILMQNDSGTDHNSTVNNLEQNHILRSDTPMSAISNSSKNMNFKEAIEQLLCKNETKPVNPASNTNFTQEIEDIIGKTLQKSSPPKIIQPAPTQIITTSNNPPNMTDLLNIVNKINQPVITQISNSNNNNTNPINNNPNLQSALATMIQQPNTITQVTPIPTTTQSPSIPSTKMIIKNLANGQPFADIMKESNPQPPVVSTPNDIVNSTIAHVLNNVNKPTANNSPFSALPGFNLVSLFENDTHPEDSNMNSLSNMTNSPIAGSGNLSATLSNFGKTNKKSSAQVRRVPVRFTQDQKRLLYQLFEINRYPKKPEREEIASKIGVPEYAVHNFFSNTRKAIYRAAACSQNPDGTPIKTNLPPDLKTGVESLNAADKYLPKDSLDREMISNFAKEAIKAAANGDLTGNGNIDGEVVTGDPSAAIASLLENASKSGEVPEEGSFFGQLQNAAQNGDTPDNSNNSETSRKTSVDQTAVSATLNSLAMNFSTSMNYENPNVNNMINGE